MIPAFETFASRYASLAMQGGAFVHRSDGTRVPIPPIATPAIYARAQLANISADAHHLARALVRLTRWLMTSTEGAPIGQRLFADLNPLESRALAQAWAAAENLATVRVDFFIDQDGRHRALEVNATIPAMQGYSDVIAESYLRAAGEHAGLDAARIAALVDENGRNTDDLLASVLAHHARITGATSLGKALSIAIVARAGDAQIGELEHYQRRWTALGHRVRIATPAQVRVGESHGGSRGEVDGFGAPDLFYRHVFLRRLADTDDFARMCLDADHFRVINPPASHLEVKGMLALLSEAVDGGPLADEIGLDSDERRAISETVPWTRLVTSDNVADLSQRAPELVLKRSWDYGGRSVFLGTDPLDPDRLASLDLPRDLSWPGLVEHAARDEHAWVVQGLVRAQAAPRVRIGPEGPREKSLYADLSAYTNLGVGVHPRGGAVRASESKIVNILGGGGLAPLLLQEVAAHVSPPAFRP